jgi:microsomal dipeptidase-like Zn-dependent dipeptidase
MREAAIALHSDARSARRARHVIPCIWPTTVSMALRFLFLSALTQALLSAGLDATAIRAIMGENAIRYLLQELRQNSRVSASTRKSLSSHSTPTLTKLI